MRQSLAVLPTLLLLLGSVIRAEEPQKSASESSFWMQKKLEYSERLLAGLASGDFEEIGQSARSMNALTRLERWVHAKRPGYRDELKAFQAANERIIRAAEKGNLDEAAEGFSQLTTSCVNCHKVVRDVKRLK
jgi:cytochrome c556